MRFPILFGSIGMACGMLGFAASPLPDLAITDLWVEDDLVCCQLINGGLGDAAAGHRAMLVLDGVDTESFKIAAAMAPGARVTVRFTKPWQCTKQADEIVVIADFEAHIKESDETNNTSLEIWSCDQAPPYVSNGPTIETLKPEWVTIFWETDEPASSAVFYDRKSGHFDLHVSDPKRTEVHRITLKNLQPYTTYHARIESVDAGGNAVTSDAFCFTTPPLPDGSPPQIERFHQINRDLPFEFSVSACDDSIVDRVCFFVDDELVLTDHAPPFSYRLDPIAMGMPQKDFYIPHDVRIVALDGVNHESKSDQWVEATRTCEVVEMDFNSPPDGDEIKITGVSVPPGTFIPIEVQASGIPEYGDCEDPPCRFGSSTQNVDLIEVFADGVKIAEATDTTRLQAEWDISGRGLGEVELMAKVKKGDYCAPLTETHRFTVDLGFVDLRILSREVARHEDHFSVTLTFTNRGTAAVSITRIRDIVRGFLVVPKEIAGWYSVRSAYRDPSRESVVIIDSSIGVGPGATKTVSYDIKPVMYPLELDYAVGHEAVEFHGLFSGEEGVEERLLVHEGAHLDAEVADAFVLSDTLIVTNPTALRCHAEHADPVFSLLGRLAEFAVVRRAALAFFDANIHVETPFNDDDFWVMGDVRGSSSNDELILADVHTGTLFLQGGKSERGEISVPGLSSSDGLASGNVFREDLTDPQRDELLLADHDSGELRAYSCFFPGDPFYASYATSFTTGDRLLVGDMAALTETPEEELLIVKPDGKVEMFSDNLTVNQQFSIEIANGDFLLIGNVFDNGWDEVLVGARHENAIRGYDHEGNLIHTAPITSGSLMDFGALCCGDVLGDSSFELVASCPAEHRIKVFAFDHESGLFELETSFDLRLDPSDGLIVGDFDDPYKDQILIGRRVRHNDYHPGEVDMFSLGGDATLGDRHGLDALISPGGAWAQKMVPGWLDGGYLLIFGEENIVPAFSNSYELSGDIAFIDFTDGFYADTAGGIKEPELAVGRIIGSSASKLSVALEHTMQVIARERAFQMSQALVVAGSEDTAEYRRDFKDQFEDLGYSVVQLQAPDETEFLSATDQKDVIFFVGHGTSTAFDAVVDSLGVDERFDPGDHSPLVYANACDTGRYADGICIAEAFLDKGACAYIGGTEIMYAPEMNQLAEGFFGRFVPGVPIGLALRNAKRVRMGDDAYAKYTSQIVHLYGDPKLEFQTADKNKVPLHDAVIQGPVASIKVAIPDLEIKSDTYDQVSIPGGARLIVPGKPMVPGYPVAVRFPRGTQVQSVALASKSGLTDIDGLNLETTTIAAFPSAASSKKGAAGPDLESWPETDFSWRVRLEPDGSTMLLLDVFPFRYAATTQHAVFANDFVFDIDYVETPVVISHFQPRKPVTALGENVRVDLGFETENPGSDILMEVTLTSDDGTLVLGAPLTRLKKVGRINSTSVEIDTNGAFAGHYELACRMTDHDGTVLAREIRPVTIGQARGLITEFLAESRPFQVGDMVKIECTFENTGDIAIDGSLVVDVWNRITGEKIAFEAPFEALPPGDTVFLFEEWVAEAASQDLRFVATGHFDGTVSDPWIID